MSSGIGDPEFARFVDEASNSLSMEDLSFRLGVLESIAMSIVAVWDAVVPQKVIRRGTETLAWAARRV
ncbi:MAG: hypothetical protein WBG86_10985 [Polyangiales bacterium]